MTSSDKSFGRTTIASHDPVRVRVQAEFLEMPGLAVSLEEATRLFGIDASSCKNVLTELVDRGFLTTAGRRFRRPD